ncbi:MAG: DUF2029 domain-containing protein [Pseudomonadota bacterium]|nr:DUF2029 domain-containing protein [Pseudomonadota bacterium]
MATSRGACKRRTTAIDQRPAEGAPDARGARHHPVIRIAWILGLFAVANLLAVDLATFEGISVNGIALWGRDFANVHSAGRLILEGRLATVYDIAAYQQWQAATFGPGISEHAYSYPPVTLIYAPLFGALPYFAALALWFGVSLVAFTWAARPWLARAGGPPWLALVLPTTLLCLWAGHYGLLLGALWLFAWANVERRPIAAGIAIGLMLVKPHLAILLPLVLVRRGAWRTIAAAAATVSLLVLTSLIFFGVEPWRAFLGGTAGSQLALVEQSQTYFALLMPTVATSLLALDVPRALAWAGQAAVALAAINALWVAQPGDAMRAGAATATATFLVLPYAYNYDMTVVGLAAYLAMVAASRADHRPGLLPGLLIAAAVFVVIPAMFFLSFYGVRIAPLLVAGLLWLLLSRPLFTDEPIASRTAAR